MISKNMSNVALERRVKKLTSTVKQVESERKSTSEALKKFKSEAGIQKLKCLNLNKKLISQLKKKDVDVTEFEEALRNISDINEENMEDHGPGGEMGGAASD